MIRPKHFFSIVALTIALLPTSAHALFSSKTDAAEQAGAVLFRDKGCPYCHGPGGAGTPKAPALTDIRNDKTWTPEKITNQLLNGGQKMPPFRESLTDNQIAELISYLRAKHRPEPPPPAAAPSDEVPHL